MMRHDDITDAHILANNSLNFLYYSFANLNFKTMASFLVYFNLSFHFKYFNFIYSPRRKQAEPCECKDHMLLVDSGISLVGPDQPLLQSHCFGGGDA